MKFPQSITICKSVFTVEYVRDLFDETGTIPLNGCIRYSDARILIKDNLSDDHKRLIVMHEIVHGAADGIFVSLEEAQVSMLATVITAILRDNPQVLDMFKETQP